jgi:hypothetical protein
MAYDRLEPIGGKRLDLLAAHLAYNAYLVSGNVNKDKVLPFTDFVPKWMESEEVVEEPKEEQLRSKAMAMVAAYGGRSTSGS